MFRRGEMADIDVLVDIDNDASMLFERAGLRMDAATDREIIRAARERWLKCLRAGTVLVALDHSGPEIGFAAVGMRDGEPFLDQLSVRTSSMRRGVGTALLYASMEVAKQMGGQVLWLTTYDHLSWNQPYYQRHGFAAIHPEQCGEEMRRELAFERSLLPDPERRVAMKKVLPEGMPARTEDGIPSGTR